MASEKANITRQSIRHEGPEPSLPADVNDLPWSGPTRAAIWVGLALASWIVVGLTAYFLL
jgi:hypothetical protein